jgi:hypothetical protein
MFAKRRDLRPGGLRRFLLPGSFLSFDGPPIWGKSGAIKVFVVITCLRLRTSSG